MAENKLHLYTGDGKGKTTAAMGLALRAAGHGFSVLVAQFMKKGNSGELKAFERFENVRVRLAPPISGFTFRMTEQQRDSARREQTDFAYRLINCELNESKPRMIVLDELAVAVSTGMVSEEDARALIAASLSFGETAVTGRGAPQWLIEISDYVSRIEAVKHPLSSQGLAAREGVEW